jgi:type IV pilus assembly protein PilV
MKHIALRHRTGQRGLTLMEVLVSMLVMALGMLGVAALQTTTMRYQLGTAERSAISVLLADYAERIRANLGAAPGVVASSPYLLAQLPAADAVNQCSTRTPCAGQELAEYDMVNWLEQVKAKLPQGNALVSGTAAQGLKVTFSWQDKEFSGLSLQCDANDSGIASQTCCPSAIDVTKKTGLRCASFTVMP